MIEISHMPVNHALEQIFVRYVRLGGVRATLMTLRAFAALTGRSGSQARPARAHSPRSDFAAASTLTNTAQRGVMQMKIIRHIFWFCLVGACQNSYSTNIIYEEPIKLYPWFKKTISIRINHAWLTEENEFVIEKIAFLDGPFYLDEKKEIDEYKWFSVGAGLRKPQKVS